MEIPAASTADADSWGERTEAVTQEPPLLGWKSQGPPSQVSERQTADGVNHHLGRARLQSFYGG